MVLSLFKKKRTTKTEGFTLEELSKGIEATVHYQKGSELETQLKMLDLTEEDFRIARSIQPLIEQEIGQLVEQFYKNIDVNSELIQMINTYSSVANLQKSLRTHIIEMFSGVMNEDFIMQRKRIAHVHVDIGLTQKWYIASFHNLFNGFVELIVKKNGLSK